MALTTLTKLDGLDMGSSYLAAKKYIKLALREDFGLSPTAAERAIELAGIEAIFRDHPESAAHTSNEAWAQYAHEVYRKHLGPALDTYYGIIAKSAVREGKLPQLKTARAASSKIAIRKAASSKVVIRKAAARKLQKQAKIP